MNYIELKERQNIPDNSPLSKLYNQFGDLLKELKKKELPQHIVTALNQTVEELNNATVTDNELKKLVKKQQTAILRLLEKELKIVPKNYYRNIWLVLGMSAFGLPLGVMFGSIKGNMGLLGIGLPIGMVIGMAAGSAMDKKALREGRQLDMEIKY